MQTRSQFRLALTMLHLVAAPSIAAEAKNCESNSVDQLTQVQCVAATIKVLDVELNRVYQQALQVLPDKDPADIRKEKEQLRKAQRAWLKFRDENCALEAGLQGSNNLSVSHLEAMCQVREIKARIQLLKGVANGTDRL